VCVLFNTLFALYLQVKIVCFFFPLLLLQQVSALHEIPYLMANMFPFDACQLIYPFAICLLLGLCVLFAVLLQITSNFCIDWISRPRRTRTKIVLEIGSVSRAISFDIHSSSYPMSTFSITLDSDLVDFKLDRSIWGGTLFWTSGITFQNSRLEMDLEIPEKLNLDFLQYLRLKSILSTQNYKVINFHDTLTQEFRKVFIQKFPCPPLSSLTPSPTNDESQPPQPPQTSKPHQPRTIYPAKPIAVVRPFIHQPPPPVEPAVQSQ